jgi:hypothetical protein
MRSATWRTERSSVVLMRSPRNIASCARRGPTPRELPKERERLVGDAVLRVVEVDPGALGGEPLATGRVGGEEIA